MLHERTIQHITSLPDEGLAEYIASGTELYEAEAIAFAKTEFQRRGLAGQLDQFQAVGRERAAQAAQHMRSVSTAPLRWDAKACAFVFGPLAISPVFVVIWLRFHTRSEYQKVRDLWRFGFFGLGFYLVLYSLLSHPDPLDSFDKWVLTAGIILMVMLSPVQEVIRGILHKKIDPNACTVCGYDLRATPNRCPECGTIPAHIDGQA